MEFAKGLAICDHKWNCWCKKSCTTWDLLNPVNNGINYQPQLVSRISSIRSKAMDILQDIFPHVFDVRIGTFVMQYDSVSCCGKSPQEFFLQILWFIYLSHILYLAFRVFELCSDFIIFFEKRDFCPSVLLPTHGLQLLEAKVPMAEDFHTSADLLFAHGSESVSLERSGWKPPTDAPEVSRLRCEHDRKVAQGVIRRNQLVNSGWVVLQETLVDLKTPHMYDIVRPWHLFFTAGYSHNKRKFRCGKLLGRKHMFQVASNLLQPFC